MAQTTVDPKKKKYTPATNPGEILKEFGGEIAGVPKQLLETAFEQITARPQPMYGEINLTGGNHAAIEQTKRVDNQAANAEVKLRQLQQFQRNEKEVFNLKQKTIENQIAKLMQDLQVEVSKLQKQTSELSSDVKKITVETKPTKVGIYHLNFFDMMITMLREIRQKVGESRMWLNKSMQKKKQKGYWAMFKKHGMNFAASDERAVASSNG